MGSGTLLLYVRLSVWESRVMLSRRGFFAKLGAAGLTVVSAPLYIPAERLAFGVPKLVVSTFVTRHGVGDYPLEFPTEQWDFHPRSEAQVRHYLAWYGSWVKLNDFHTRETASDGWFTRVA